MFAQFLKTLVSVVYSISMTIFIQYSIFNFWCLIKSRLCDAKPLGSAKCGLFSSHYCDVIMGAIASQITSLAIVYSTIYSDADQRKHQSSASLAFVRGIHRGPTNSPHKRPVTRKMFAFDDVIMRLQCADFRWNSSRLKLTMWVNYPETACKYVVMTMYWLHRVSGINNTNC